MHNLKSFLSKNAPVVLTSCSVVGVLATVALSFKTAVDLVYEDRDWHWRTKKDIVKKAVPKFVSTFVVGSATVACIICTNMVNRQRQEALTSAYILLDRMYKNYKAKVTDMYGKDAEEKVEEAITNDKLEKTDQTDTDDGTVLFYEPYYDLFFRRKYEELIDAEYQLNRKYVIGDEVCLNDFYEFLHLPKTKTGGTLGWSWDASDLRYGYVWLDFDHKLVTKDNKSYYVIEAVYPPTADYKTHY